MVNLYWQEMVSVSGFYTTINKFSKINQRNHLRFQIQIWLHKQTFRKFTKIASEFVQFLFKN